MLNQRIRPGLNILTRQHLHHNGSFHTISFDNIRHKPLLLHPTTHNRHNFATNSSHTKGSANPFDNLPFDDNPMMYMMDQQDIDPELVVGRSFTPPGATNVSTEFAPLQARTHTPRSSSSSETQHTPARQPPRSFEPAKLTKVATTTKTPTPTKTRTRTPTAPPKPTTTRASTRTPGMTSGFNPAATRKSTSSFRPRESGGSFTGSGKKLPDIVNAQQRKELVLTMLKDRNKLYGKQFRGFPGLNQLLRGHRLGELTLISGTTGVGKTTFLSQYSIDLSMSGVSTLWCSLEIKMDKLIADMCKQYVAMRKNPLQPGDFPNETEDENDATNTGIDGGNGGNEDEDNNKSKRKKYGSSDNNKSDFAEFDGSWHDLVGNNLDAYYKDCNMQYMNHHGAIGYETLLETLRNNMKEHKFEHIIIDNLQFMLSEGVGSNKYSNPFDTQNRVLHSLREFATRQNVHITLVVHPRKGDDDEMLTMSSIYGGAMATQEADNVIFIQKPVAGRATKTVNVAKNRFAGSTGYLPLQFDRKTRCYRDLSKAAQIVRKNMAEMSDEQEHTSEGSYVMGGKYLVK